MRIRKRVFDIFYIENYEHWFKDGTEPGFLKKGGKRMLNADKFFSRYITTLMEELTCQTNVVSFIGNANKFESLLN